MTSFKLAAIQVLKDAGEALHYDEITRRALEKGLIETSGKTPEATMNAQITTDIKYNKEKAAFIKQQPGFYALNPQFTPAQEKLEVQEEEEKEEENKERISTQYIGKAGEHLVISELLFRGFNASLMTVDDGIDVVATKDNQLYNIQVKTSTENKFNSYVFDIRITSLQKYDKNNTYYIFLLKGKQQTNFLILPYFEIQKNVDQQNILTINKNTRYRVNLKIRNEKLYLGNKENDMTYYLNNWNMIK